ncbi:MAG: TRAP transporter large permease subunit, partial [Rhodoferax sp.]|nr:TRAP transporter large permease subunit [Rhodoferax sp.]
FRLSVRDAGDLLTRLGTPGALRDGSGQLEGQISWSGSPLTLHYPSMSGQFDVKMGRGQFLKADAGAAKLLGVDLVHFGVLVVLNMMIGLIHPPFGMLLFVTKALTGIPIAAMAKEGWPFLLMLLLLLLAITLYPPIVLWLPQRMGYATG